MRDRLATLAIIAVFFGVLVWWNGRAQEDAKTRAIPRVKQWSLKNFGDVSELVRKNAGAKAVLSVGIENETVGDITIELYPDVAPVSVENFILLAESGYYDGLTFHRLVPGIVLQGGDQAGDGTGSPGWRINAEFNDKKHTSGTVAMARRGDNVNSAGSQFYICLNPVPQWDGQYSIFGHVVSGMEHVEALAAVGASGKERPRKKLLINSVRILRPEPDHTDEAAPTS